MTNQYSTVPALAAIQNDIDENGIETVYQRHGYENRQDYLDSLADENGEEVYALAELLGESEDFDGLISAVEDLINA